MHFLKTAGLVKVFKIIDIAHNVDAGKFVLLL